MCIVNNDGLTDPCWFHHTSSSSHNQKLARSLEKEKKDI